MQRVKELVNFGGFLDCEYLRRTLAKEFQLMESRYFFLPSFNIKRCSCNQNSSENGPRLNVVRLLKPNRTLFQYAVIQLVLF